MVKTNFKCMYLVDDMLYKKLSHSERGVSVNQNTPSLNIPDIFSERENDITERQFENRAPLQSRKYSSDTQFQAEKFSSQDRDNSTDKLIQTEESFPKGESNEKTSLSDSSHLETNQDIVNMDTTENSDPACKRDDIGGKTSRKIKRNIIVKRRLPLNHLKTNQAIVNMDTTENSDPACKCNVIDEQTSKKIKNTFAVKRSLPSSVSNKDAKKIKSTADIVSSSNVQKEDEYIPDSDPELQELRDRFNKIKYDINYPPWKTIPLGKAHPAGEPKDYNKGMKRKSKFLDKTNMIKKSKTEYKCRFCGSFYKSKQGLNRHETNIHDMNSRGSETKRKRNDEQSSGSYVKRKKPQPYKTISYQNYF